MIQNIHGFGKLSIRSDLNGGMPAPAGSAPATAIAEPQDRVTLSKKAQNAKNDHGAGGAKDEENLSSEEKQRVNELKQRDAEVKAHEQAHMAAGGGVVQGGAAYEYQRGPDGRTYAVGGEVQIDASAENTPEGTIAKMQQVQRAALAPAQPSGTDRAVATRAAQVEARARAEKTQTNIPSTGATEPGKPSPTDDSTPSASPTAALGSYLPGAYAVRRSDAVHPSKSTGLRIDLQI